VSEVRYDGWIPCRVYWRGLELMVEWCYLGSTGFRKPFFGDTIQAALQTPFGSVFRRHTPISELCRWRKVSPGAEPTGFVLHGGRCGSTLITRMLAQVERNLVLSEPAPLDTILMTNRPGRPIAAEERIEWARAMLSALGQRRSGSERHLFVKLEPRDTFALPVLREAWPGAPWIFVYRDPVEVLVSNLREPAGFLFQIAAGPPEPDEKAAAVLGAVMERAVSAFPDPMGLPVNYRELPEAVWKRIARHFRVEFTADEIARFREATGVHAKRPHEKFESDGEEKARAASERVRALAERWMAPHFARLERIRLS
jgi:hypothetical protein